MRPKYFKFFFSLILAIILTLGLSISFQSLLAAWTAPLAEAPICVAGSPGCDAPLNVGPLIQTKSGALWINTGISPYGLIVEKGKVGIGTTNPGYTLDVNGDLNLASRLYMSGNSVLYLPSNNPETGPWNPIWSAIGTGRSIYPDEEFASGANSIGVYNNSGGSSVTITRQTGQANIPNSTGAVLKVSYDGIGPTSPNFGGIIQAINSVANKTFVQRFRAKIPVGKTLVINENSQGTNSTSYWLTNNVGTGKWEDYARVSHTGNTGTFSSGGHISVAGGSGAFDWYISSMNVYEVNAPITAGVNTWTSAQAFPGGATFPGSGVWTSTGRVGIGTAAPAAILDLGQLPSSTEGLIIKIGATTPWSPFVIYKADGSIAFKIDENGNMTGGSAGGWSRNSASGYLYTTALTDKVGIGTTGPTSKFDIRSSGVDGKIGFDAIDDGTTWGNVIISQKPSSLTGIGLGVFGKSDGSKISRFVVNTDNMYLGYPLRPGDGGSLAGTQGTGNLLINGNVGIGTTDPSGGGIIASKFTIKNDSSTSLALLGTSNAKILAINPESNSGATFYNGGGGSWVAAMTLLNGNVGIGTADPAGYKLKVVGNEKIHGKLVVDNTGGYDVDTTYNITTPGIYAAKGEFANLCLGSGGGTDCKTSWAQIVSAGGLPAGINGQTLRYNNGWVPNSILFNDGTSVSIGTAGSLSKLSVNGGLHVGGDSDAGDNNILADGTISAATGATGGFRSTTYTAGQNLIWAFGNAPGYGFSYKQGYPDDIRFHFGDYANPQFLIRQDGNVGIGTTNPTSLLHLYKNLSGTNAEIAIQSGNGTTVQDKWAIYQDQGAGDLRFWNTNTPGGGNALTVLKTGYVGIGTAAPTAKLEVAGQVKITGGNPGANKVLTSDAAGLASWQASAASNAPFFIETIYGDGDLPWRSTANTPQTMRYVYGPFSYAMPGCDSGYTKYYRLYAEFVDTISGGQGVYARIALDGGTNLDFNMGGTWGGSPSYRNFLSGLFQIASTNHASIQSWVNGSAGPYLEIRKLQIWAYCL